MKKFYRSIKSFNMNFSKILSESLRIFVDKLNEQKYESKSTNNIEDIDFIDVSDLDKKNQGRGKVDHHSAQVKIIYRPKTEKLFKNL